MESITLNALIFFFGLINSSIFIYIYYKILKQFYFFNYFLFSNHLSCYAVFVLNNRIALKKISKSQNSTWKVCFYHISWVLLVAEWKVDTTHRIIIPLDKKVFENLEKSLITPPPG